jgi:hypothetical protein
MKVFKMNDCDWVAANSAEEAIKWYMKEFGVGRDEIYDELEEESLDREIWDYYNGKDRNVVLKMFQTNGDEIVYNDMQFRFNDGLQVLTSFKKIIGNSIETVPYIIASTEY